MNEDIIKVIWDALQDYREKCIPDSNKENDQQWDEICYAMACISDEMTIEP